MKTLANLRIQYKIGILLALLGMVTIGAALYSGRTLNQADQRYSSLVNTVLPDTAKLIRANRLAVEMLYAGYRTMVYNGNSVEARDAAKMVEKSYTEATRYIAEVIAAEPGDAEALNGFVSRLDTIHETVRRAVAAGIQDHDDEARRILITADQQLNAFGVDLAKFNDKRMTSTQEMSKRLSSDADATSNAIIIIALVGIAAAMGIAMFLSRSQIVGPLAALQNAMQALASGDLNAEVPGTERKDEVGGMAKSVLVFKEAGQAQQMAAEIKQASDAAQKLVVDTLEGRLAKLAQGDLTATIDIALAAEYDGLKRNFNATVLALQELIGAVMDSTEAISTGSAEIAQASEDLARRTESSAASLEETSAAVSQMDQRIKATANAATRTVERANGAIGVVDSGRAVADEAVQAMSRVSDSAKGIDNVIEGLDKIAFQTRVLAMNAAVEAGRAGEAGRGFAVVADLVSALAMRAEEEAGRARDQLTATQTDITAAVEMVRRVDGALGAIVGDVNEVHSLLETMANDNQVQATAVTQVATAVNTIDQSTQQNAAMVEQTSAAARNLNSEVASLSERASRFNTGRGTSRPAVRAMVRTLPVQSPSHAPSVASVRKIAADTEEWASF